MRYGNRAIVLCIFFSFLLEFRIQTSGFHFYDCPLLFQVIGSSLLFVHDRRGTANVWMIDFGKTTVTPAHISLRHDVAWEPGTHEDGYLLGLQNLIDTLQDTIQMVKENREEAVDGSAQEGEQTIGENEKMLLKGEVEVKTTNGENNALMTPIQPGNRTL